MVDPGTVRLTQSEVMDGLSIKVKLPRLFAARVWLMAQLIRFAAFVGGCEIEIEIEEKSSKPS